MYNPTDPEKLQNKINSLISQTQGKDIFWQKTRSNCFYHNSCDYGFTFQVFQHRLELTMVHFLDDDEWRIQELVANGPGPLAELAGLLQG